VSPRVFSNRRRKRPFLPVFPRFSDFFSPPTGPGASEMKAVWHRAALRHPASAAESPVRYSVGNFCGGRKTTFCQLWGLPLNPSFHHLSGGRFSSLYLPPRGVRRRRPRPNRTVFGDSTPRKPSRSGTAGLGSRARHVQRVSQSRSE
jgi:hypothetical protein